MKKKLKKIGGKKKRLTKKKNKCDIRDQHGRKSLTPI
jgi:hypothetical protein